MDKLYHYNSALPLIYLKTRHPLEKFIDILMKDFFAKYTETNLEKMQFEYSPYRLSDPDDYENWMHINQNFQKLPPLETDEEIERTLNFVKKLSFPNDIIQYKLERIPNSRRAIEFDLHIDSYKELLDLVKSKCGNCQSNYIIIIEKEFQFIDVDYSGIRDFFGQDYKYKIPEKNKIHLYISNGGDIKIYHTVGFSIVFPKFTENEKDFLRKIAKILKINFSPKYFYFSYKTKKGTIRYKKEKVEL
jgi:hypothetical protein